MEILEMLSDVMEVFKNKNINDLQVILSSLNKNLSVSNVRNKFHIAIIDDQEFSAETNLERCGYNIKSFSDLRDYSQIEGYNIILCDLMGVGIQFDSESQGARLIKEIKKKYPEKYVIAYSGGAANQDILSLAIAESDAYLHKDANIDTWQEALDEAILQITDPIRGWKKLRHRLLDEGVTPEQLVALENQFVRSFLKGNEQSNKDLLTLCQKRSINKDVVKVIFSVLGKALYEFYLEPS